MAAAHDGPQRSGPVLADARCRGAVAAARSVPVARWRAAGHRGRPRRPGHGRLRATTGAGLAAFGAIMWLGVHAPIGGVAVQSAGFVLVVAGVAWMLIPLPAKRSRASRALDAALDYLSFDPADPAPRCPLTELLDPAAGEQDR